MTGPHDPFAARAPTRRERFRRVAARGERVVSGTVSALRDQAHAVAGSAHSAVTAQRSPFQLGLDLWAAYLGTAASLLGCGSDVSDRLLLEVDDRAEAVDPVTIYWQMDDGHAVLKQPLTRDDGQQIPAEHVVIIAANDRLSVGLQNLKKQPNTALDDANFPPGTYRGIIETSRGDIPLTAVVSREA